ncbi:MAG TPA: carboxypeptidase M32 [Isosphaeraceae bacterium]|nr:carboxypeptidase M32 [Isosphaeraceae bacterium]
MNARATYAELIQQAQEVSLLSSCMSLLSWDEQTYMPKRGVEHRGNQMALLAGLHHEKATDLRMGERLDALADSELVRDPLAPEAVNVRELRRTFDRLTKLPRSLVEELARTVSMAQQEWVSARKASDFAQFCPWLEKVVALKRQEAECLTAHGPLYDALLDEFEPGASSREIAALFESLRRDLVPLVDAIQGSSRRPDLSVLNRDFPADAQERFGRLAAAAIGFDFQAGRLDTTAHPFCTRIGPGDCRITTRYALTSFTDSFFGILHEVGHGLYEQGLDPLHQGTPMGEAVSLGVHESQSRLWENAVGRSRSFWLHFFPKAHEHFAHALADVSFDAFLFAINQVAPSLNRVQADEVTYNLHILIRFELEQALLSGDLEAAGVPGAWNDLYERTLGLTPPNDAEGCLQDIHWSAGLVGYFPTYTLGNLFAAQLYDRASEELGDLETEFARGEFGTLLTWLRDRVHRHGHRYHSAPLIQQVTGAPPDHRPLVRALRRKYGELYAV